MSGSSSPWSTVFQSTLPVWGATSAGSARSASALISIHAPRVGSDGRCCRWHSPLRHFNPRSPCGERPLSQSECWTTLPSFQSTLPVWGATGEDPAEDDATEISIHAPRVGSDAQVGATAVDTIEFQSTLPVWGATTEPSSSLAAIKISIHAPRVGSDAFSRTLREGGDVFQSTLPVWGATEIAAHITATPGISIHAPRVGSDGVARGLLADDLISIHAPRVGSDGKIPHPGGGRKNFNPRSPCGERLASGGSLSRNFTFQSTLPVWGATARAHKSSGKCGISIHAPRVGSDVLLPFAECGILISIHAPRVGSDSRNI